MAFPNFASKQAQATGCILDRTTERSSSFWAAATRPLSAKTSQTRRDIGGTTGAGNMPRSVPYDDYLIESLKDRRRAEAYLNAALEEDDPRVFLLALRNVAQARGMSKLAAKSSLNRESLYKMLSKRGNPQPAESRRAPERSWFSAGRGIQGRRVKVLLRPGFNSSAGFAAARPTPPPAETPPARRACAGSREGAPTR